MDTLLAAGDHALDGRGLPVSIEGAEEAIQQALIRLCVRRGAFALQPDLGSELYKLQHVRTGPLDRLALSYAQQALGDMAGVAVESAGVAREDRDTLLVTVGLRHMEQIYGLEVQVR